MHNEIRDKLNEHFNFNWENFNMNKGSAFFLGAIIIVMMAFWMFVGIVDIKPTEVGVEIDKVQGKVMEMPRGVGYHVFNKVSTDIVVYNVAARAFPGDVMKSENSDNYSLDLKTNDGQNIRVDLTVLYALKPNEVPALHQTIGSNYEDQILLPQIRSEARIAIGSYAAEEIYSGKVRDAIQKEIATRLQNAVAKFPAIQIQDALIRHFAFSVEFERAIEQKKLAAQQVEINKNRAMAQEEESKRMEAEARGGKLRAIQDAEGRAQSAKIEADAERYKLEQEALGKLANYKADAEGKKLQADALGGGQNVVALKFAENISDKFRIFAVPIGQNSTSLMDLSGIMKGMFTQAAKE
ncbi:MAG: prohibitin family protein [Candidatus Omnitrophica bacterium]|nr:prohibitin family protein [Candidatus Omnitrophota bacterium]